MHGDNVAFATVCRELAAEIGDVRVDGSIKAVKVNINTTTLGWLADIDDGASIPDVD